MNFNEGNALLEDLRERDYKERDENNYRDLKLGFTPVRTNYWIIDRLYLYPNLFKSDLAGELATEFQTYISGQHTGSSERLTFGKISEVVHSMLDDDLGWWLNPNRKRIFHERFRQRYPKCCDGRKPDLATPKQPSVNQRKIASPKRKSGKSKSSGFGGFLLVVLLIYGCVKGCRSLAHSNKETQSTKMESKQENMTAAGQSLQLPLIENKVGEESAPKQKILDSFEGIPLPCSVVTLEKIILLNAAGAETSFPPNTIIMIEKRTDSGTLTMKINGALFVGNETRLAKKIELR